MKKILVSLFMMLAVISLANAQHYNVKHSDFNRVSISFKSDIIQVKDVKTSQGYFSQISMADYQNSNTVGCPQLPMMTHLIEIPLCDSVVATISNAQYDEFDASELGIMHSIYPVQNSYPKSYRGEKTFVQNQQVYQTNSFYAEPLVSVQKSGTMRDVTMAEISVAPVQYNPVTNRVRVYKSMDVTVTFVNANIPGTYELKSRYGSPMFKVASNAVINPMETRDEFSGAPIKYLIIANSMFAGNDNLEQFIAWKKRLGYIVVAAYTNDPAVGTTTTSIKNYIMTHVNNATAEDPAPTFILFIGDVAQLPPFNGTALNSHVTDLYYATWTSGDNIPDCYYGRFSAQNVAQLTPQIEKSLMYEQYTMPDPSYLGNAVLIAGTDADCGPTYGDGQVNYIYNNYINTNSTTHDYTTVYKHNYNCSGQAATIRSEIGAGCGWANYTAHGGEDGWSDPGFSNSQVSAMNNANKYGVMIGNCCLTGKFNYSSDCFAEALLRAANKGAMAYIGGSEVTYWDEDYHWAVGVRSSISANPTYNASNLGAYDRIFHKNGESPANWVSSLSAYLQSGNMSVQSSSSSRKLYYWEIYHLFGDPSIRPYLGIPTQINVSSSDVIITGASTYDVSTDAPYAYVALTYNNNVVCATFADGNGNATLTLPELTQGEYELAIGAQNKIQYFKTVNVIVPQGAYVLASDVALSTASTPDAGATIDWNLSVVNVGAAAASNAYAKMTSSTPGVTILTDSLYIGSLAVDGTRDFSNAFSTKLSDSFEDGDIAQFTVIIYWSNSNSAKTVAVPVNAAKLEVVNYIVSNANGSTSFAPGDLVNITFTNKNNGHATLQHATVDLTSNYTGASVLSDANSINALAPSQTINNIFQVQLGNNVPDHTIIPLYYHSFYKSKHFIDTIYLTLGTAMEDFESGDFSQYNWSNSGNYAWTITNEAPYAGTYCARSKSGLGNNQTSSMQITIYAFEAGNVSYFRKVSSELNWDKFYFYIDGAEMEAKSGTVAWSQASFPVAAGTHTYKFEYSKDNSQSSGSDCAWVDNIIFPGYGTMAVEDTVDNPDGIANFNMPTANVSVYPNPTSGQLTVNSNEAIQNIIIYDLSGRVVDMQDINAETTTNINVAHLNSGIYFIKTQLVNKQTKTSKFIKQ